MQAEREREGGGWVFSGASVQGLPRGTTLLIAQTVTTSVDSLSDAAELMNRASSEGFSERTPSPSMRFKPPPRTTRRETTSVCKKGVDGQSAKQQKLARRNDGTSC